MKAQEPVFVNLTEKNGLPDKEFYNITEDSKGFIWLCADKGFFRYDGRNYKSYTNKKQRGLSVFGVKEDNKGRIWCNNISGQFFYVQDDILHTFIDLSEQLKGELSIFEIKGNDLFVFALKKLYRVSLTTKKIDVVYNSKYNISSPVKIKDEICFLDGINGLKINKDNKINNFLNTNLTLKDKKEINFDGNRSYTFKVESEFFLYIKRYSKHVFFKLDTIQKTFKEVKGFAAIANQKIQDIFVNHNEVWVSTTFGVWVFNSVENQFQLKKHFLKDKNISKVIRDRDSNYWITTLNNGLYIIPDISIETYAISNANKNISSLDKINNQTLIYGSNNGNVGVVDIKTNKEICIDLPKASRVSAVKYNPNKHVSYIGKEEDGFVLDHNTLNFKRVKAFYSAKNILILENKDVMFVNYKYVYIYKNDNLILLSNNRRPYTSFFNTTDHSVFISYVDNLVKYDSLWNPKVIQHNSKPIYGLSITKSSNNIIWVATFKDGVFGIENDNVIYHLSTKNGLISNRVEKIKADGDTLWIATDSGLQSYDIKNKTLQTLTKSDGVLSYDISGIEIFENKVVFSSNVGLFSIDKKEVFKAKKQEQNIYFNAFEVNEQSRKIKTNYILENDENTIKIGFNVNGFKFNRKGKFRYRLLGLNNNWFSTSTTINYVKYNSLHAGEYTFQVKPVLEEASEEGVIKSLQFSIQNPFWNTWWFISCMSILILGSIILYFKRKIKQKEQQRKREIKQLSLDNELITLKLENLRSQMNPHFIFNALNSIQEYIVLNQKKLATEYLGKFADLIRTYLSHSTKGSITLKEEVDCLEMYLELEKLRFEDKLQYTITITGHVKPEGLHIPTMLIQPYAENALKHGLLHRKTDRVLKINFDINTKAKTVECIIIDNGVGREQAEKIKARSYKKHKSFATKANQDRLALLNYGKEKQIGVTIIDLLENEVPTGTQVNIIIPYTIY